MSHCTAHSSLTIKLLVGIKQFEQMWDVTGAPVKYDITETAHLLFTWLNVYDLKAYFHVHQYVVHVH